MHRCPDCGERFEGNICTFCGRPVPQEELEQEKAVQEKSDEQANINNSEEVSKSAVENTALNSAGVQPVNEYAQNGYSTQSVNNYAQKNYNSQHSYGNPNYSNSAMPSGYTNQNQPFSDVVNTREKKKSKTTLIVVLVIASVLIISLCVIGYTVITNVIKNNKWFFVNSWGNPKNEIKIFNKRQKIKLSLVFLIDRQTYVKYDCENA